MALLLFNSSNHKLYTKLMENIPNKPTIETDLGEVSKLSLNAEIINAAALYTIMQNQAIIFAKLFGDKTADEYFTTFRERNAINERAIKDEFHKELDK